MNSIRRQANGASLTRWPNRCMAFTLMEAVVVMAIIGVLAMLLIPAIHTSRSAARKVACASNLHSLGGAYMAAALDSHGKLPDGFYSYVRQGEDCLVSITGPGLASGFPATDPSELPLVCPEDNAPVKLDAASPGTERPWRLSYGYNIALPLIFRNMSRVEFPSETVTFYDAHADAVEGEWQYSADWAEATVDARHRGEANYLFADGHVETRSNFPSIFFDGGGSLHKWLPYAFPAHEMSGFVGMVCVNPNNSGDNNELSLSLPDGRVITQEDMKSDTLVTGVGFNSDYLEYTGNALALSVKPHAIGLMVAIKVDGKTFALPVNTTTTFSSRAMSVHLYNDRRDKHNRPMGKWWIAFSATDGVVVSEK